jgi:hypothetical protein
MATISTVPRESKPHSQAAEPSRIRTCLGWSTAPWMTCAETTIARGVSKSTASPPSKGLALLAEGVCTSRALGGGYFDFARHDSAVIPVATH